MIIILTEIVTYQQHHISKIRMKLLLLRESVPRKLQIWFNLGLELDRMLLFSVVVIIVTHFVSVCPFFFPDMEYDVNPSSVRGAGQRLFLHRHYTGP